MLISLKQTFFLRIFYFIFVMYFFFFFFFFTTWKHEPFVETRRISMKLMIVLRIQDVSRSDVAARYRFVTTLEHHLVRGRQGNARTHVPRKNLPCLHVSLRYIGIITHGSDAGSSRARSHRGMLSYFLVTPFVNRTTKPSTRFFPISSTLQFRLPHINQFYSHKICNKNKQQQTINHDEQCKFPTKINIRHFLS